MSSFKCTANSSHVFTVAQWTEKTSQQMKLKQIKNPNQTQQNTETCIEHHRHLLEKELGKPVFFNSSFKTSVFKTSITIIKRVPCLWGVGLLSPGLGGCLSNAGPSVCVVAIFISQIMFLILVLVALKCINSINTTGYYGVHQPAWHGSGVFTDYTDIFTHTFIVSILLRGAFEAELLRTFLSFPTDLIGQAGGQHHHGYSTVIVRPCASWHSYCACAMCSWFMETQLRVSVQTEVSQCSLKSGCLVLVNQVMKQEGEDGRPISDKTNDTWSNRRKRKTRKTGDVDDGGVVLSRSAKWKVMSSISLGSRTLWPSY